MTQTPERENLMRTAYGSTMRSPLTGTTPIDIIINTSRNIKVKKEHCFLYDKMVHKSLSEVMYNSDKRHYYKELFEDAYNGNTELTPSEINGFFDDKQLLYTERKITDRVADEPITLFVIPVTFDYTELSEDAVVEKFISDTHSTLFGDNNENIKELLLSSDRVYYLPCLMREKLLTESEYVSKIREELSKLKEHIDIQFMKTIRDQPQQYQGLHKNMAFFFNPDGNVSLEFYKKKTLRNKAKNSEFLNKHLFKQFRNLGNGQSYGFERNIIFDEKLYTNPLFASIPESKDINYIEFLIRKVFEFEILSSLDMKNIESFYGKGILPLDILYKKIIKKNLYDFDTKKLSSVQKYRFTLIDSDEYVVIKFKKPKSLNEKYHQINIIGEDSHQNGRTLHSLTQYDMIYLKITSSGTLKMATIYAKKRNFYQSLCKGVLTINPDDQDKYYKELKPTNLARGIQAKRFYYIENFVPTMKSLSDFYSSKNILDNKNGEIVSKSNLRENFVRMFTSRASLNDYFLFCLNHPKYVKLIDKSFYDKAPSHKNSKKKSIIKMLIKELFKTGGNFFSYVQEKKGENKSSQTSYGHRVYNKYIVKNLISGKVDVKIVGSGSQDVINVLHPTMQQTVGDKDLALVRIRLEELDESDKLETNENMNMIELLKPSKKKCFTRKKLLDKRVKKLVKNVTQKLQYKLRAYV